MDLADLGAIGVIVILLVIGLSIFIYFLPSFIASRRKAQNGCAIFIVNLPFRMECSRLDCSTYLGNSQR